MCRMFQMRQTFFVSHLQVCATCVNVDDTLVLQACSHDSKLDNNENSMGFGRASIGFIAKCPAHNPVI